MYNFAPERLLTLQMFVAPVNWNETKVLVYLLELSDAGQCFMQQ